MLQSINLDNIPDDALFESGTDGWNQNTALPSVSRQRSLGTRTSAVTLQNQEGTRNTLTEAQGLNMERQDPARRQVLQPVSSQTRPSTRPEALMAVFEPSNEQVQQVAAAARQEFGNGGARAKTTKNKENKNKNSAMKRSGLSTPGSNEDRSRHSQSPNKDNTQKWEPELRYKKYDDDEGMVGSDVTYRKVVNQSKQKKQNINKNAARSQTVPLKMAVNGDNDTMMNYASIPLPAGLDPASNPRNVDHIYLKNTDSGQQNREDVRDNDLETDFFSVHHVGKDTNKGKNSSQRTFETPNFTQIHNNLWEGNREKNKGNRNVTHLVLDQSRNNAVHVIQNDLDMDSVPQDGSATVVKLTSNLPLPRPSSDSRLDSHSIVVPYEHNTTADNTLQMNSMSASADSSPQSIVSTISFNTSPTSTFTSSLIQPDPLNFSDSLPSSLSSNVLFGEGVTNDYLYAQKLQQQFDREHEALQRRRQFDILPNNRTYIIPAEEHFNQHAHPVAEENDEELFNTIDYTTANEFPTLSDSLTNDITPVYDPNEDERPTQTQAPVYISLESEMDPRAETENSGDESARPECSDIVIPHLIENDEPYPQSYAPRDPIVVRFDEGTNVISPSEQSVETSDCLVARGSGTRLSEQVGDAEYARRIQEQQDEEFARMLQEQEGEAEHQHGNRVNLVNFERNNTRRNYQPLHTRFGHTWTNRPLRVGPPIGGAANNVADSRLQSRNTWDRPLQQRQGEESEFAYLDSVHNISINEEYLSRGHLPVGNKAWQITTHGQVSEEQIYQTEHQTHGYDIPPGQDYYYRYQNDPDFMLDEYGEDRLISINRDPRLLATLLMTRAPDMMVPNDIDLNDYEALWELAENLGEVRRVGMDQNDISLLPVHTYKAPTSSNSEDNKTDCLVCLNEFSEGDRLRTLTCCHIYHVDCIDEWLRRNAICPVCRQPAVQRH